MRLHVKQQEVERENASPSDNVPTQTMAGYNNMDENEDYDKDLDSNNEANDESFTDWVQKDYSLMISYKKDATEIVVSLMLAMPVDTTHKNGKTMRVLLFLASLWLWSISHLPIGELKKSIAVGMF